MLSGLPTRRAMSVGVLSSLPHELLACCAGFLNVRTAGRFAQGSIACECLVLTRRERARTEDESTWGREEGKGGGDRGRRMRARRYIRTCPSEKSEHTARRTAASAAAGRAAEEAAANRKRKRAVRVRYVPAKARKTAAADGALAKLMMVGEIVMDRVSEGREWRDGSHKMKRRRRTEARGDG